MGGSVVGGALVLMGICRPSSRSSWLFARKVQIGDRAMRLSWVGKATALHDRFLDATRGADATAPPLFRLRSPAARESGPGPPAGAYGNLMRTAPSESPSSAILLAFRSSVTG